MLSDVDTTSVSRAAISEPIAVRAITQAVVVFLRVRVVSELILLLPFRSFGGRTAAFSTEIQRRPEIHRAAGRNGRATIGVVVAGGGRASHAPAAARRRPR